MANPRKLCTFGMSIGLFFLSACSTNTTTLPDKNPAPISDGSFTDSLSVDDPNKTRWQVADGWSNGSPFDTCWKANAFAREGGVGVFHLDSFTGCAKSTKGAEYRTNDYFGYGSYQFHLKAPLEENGVVMGAFVYRGPQDKDNDNPAHNEIDFEFFKGGVQLNYFHNGVGGHEVFLSATDLGFNPKDDFHYYRFTWDATKIEFAIDGVIKHTATNDIPKAEEGKMKIMMNLWKCLAATWCGTAPAQIHTEGFVDQVAFTASGGPQVAYKSSNLAGHRISAECNPGATVSCACSASDVQLLSSSDKGEVVSNVNLQGTYVNAIGYKPFLETFPDGKVISLGTYRYRYKVRLPILPKADPQQQENPQAVHMMIQLWDGRNALWENNKRTMEFAIYWDLNPWDPDHGRIKLYTTDLKLFSTDIRLVPDTNWHEFELMGDFAKQKYISVTIDGQTQKVDTLAPVMVHQPGWGNDVSLNITTESMAAFPGFTCENKFIWKTEFKDVELSYFSKIVS
ncbi:MAG: family 16 glycosylhydrolase [Nitrospirota bacterium]